MNKKLLDIKRFVWDNAELLPDNSLSVAPELGIVVKDSRYMRDMLGVKKPKNINSRRYSIKKRNVK